MSDPVAETCPACGSGQTHRLISQSSFVLKGSGWYVTDYARKDKSGAGTGTHGKVPPKPADGAPAAAQAPAAAAPDSAATPSPAPATPSAAPSAPSTPDAVH
jgi:hypothetical protein